MKTSIATVSISGDLPEKLNAIAKAGFSGVEIFENDLLIHDASPADVRRMVSDHGWRSRSSSRSAISRACRSLIAAAALTGRSASSTSWSNWART